MKNKIVNLAKNLFLALGITAVSSSIPVTAVTLNSSDVGRTFEVDWFLGAGEDDNDGGATSTIDLSAHGLFKLTSYSDDNLSLDVTLTNTTELSNDVSKAGITRFGFSATPDITEVHLTDIENDHTDTDRFVGAKAKTGKKKNFPGGFSGIDVCVFTKEGNKCGGSQNTALAAKEFDNFSLDIYGDFAEGVTFSQFPAKFQTSEDSFSFGGEDNLIAEVPEPGLIVALGLFTASSLLLKKKQQA